MNARYGCSDVEARRRGAMEEGVATWRYGGLEASCSCGDTKVWRHGALEARCSCTDMEVWRRTLGVATRRYETWSS